VPDLIPIDDPNDPRVAAYRDIKERDLVGRQGLFIAEGETVLRAFVRDAPRRVQSLLIDGKRPTSWARCSRACRPGVPVYVVGQAVLDAIAGFHLHRGVLAVGAKPEPLSAEALLAGQGRRAGGGAGADGHRQSRQSGRHLPQRRRVRGRRGDPGRRLLRPFYRKAIRVSIGATLSVPTAWLAPGEDVVDLLERHGFQGLALSPAAGETLARLTPPARAAVLLGAEGPGLSQAVMAACGPSASRWRAASTR
jgi:tRNA G18 (ribose-2'-O)-methylase SpoU